MKTVRHLFSNSFSSPIGTLALLILGLLPLRFAFSDQPRVPTDDAEVLERLPKMLTLNRDNMKAIRERLNADPDNVEFAAVAAKGYMKMGKLEGDPRFYGYARAAIKQWWESDSPPIAIAMVRAKLKERDHDYAGALEDVTSVLHREPKNEQAWIEVANLNRVLGNYAQAWTACEKLKTFGDSVSVAVASVPLMAANGQAEEAYQLLREQMQVAASETSKRQDVLNWGLTLQAIIAESLGRTADANKHFQDALNLNPDDYYLKRAYAEFLLDQDRDGDVVQLLQGDLNDNGTLLLAAIAAERTDHSLADQWRSKLAERFHEIRLRGSQPHGRFEARFELELNHDAGRALELALENWNQQKESRDIRNVLEAALAAKQPGAAASVVQFVYRSKLEDVRIKALIEQLIQQATDRAEIDS